MRLPGNGLQNASEKTTAGPTAARQQDTFIEGAGGGCTTC